MNRAVVLTIAMLGPTPPLAAGVVAPNDITVDERLGATIPLELRLRDSRAREVVLGDYFTDGKPVLLVLAYYDCPMLCGLVLRGAATALQGMSWVPGREYRVITVSFDPEDGPREARARQESLLRAMGGDVDPERWPFLTGDAESIAKLTTALGFTAIRDESTGQFAHPAVIFALSPKGLISRYLYGMQFRPLDVRLALLEASEGRTGSSLDRLMLRCYAYDPATRRYGPLVTGLMRVGASGILASLGLTLALLWRRERRRAAP